MKLISSIKTAGIKIIWKLTPTCADMRQLASQSQDRSLSLWETIKVRLHFLICVWCERYFKQLRFLQEAARESTHHPSPKGDPKLPGKAKESMKHALENERGNS